MESKDKEAWEKFCKWTKKLRVKMLEDGFSNEEIDKIFYNL